MTAARTSRAARLRSLAFWEALATRYPLGSRWELVRPAASVVLANLLTARALLNGQMKPWELVLLVALEALCLSAIAWGQNLLVPKEARPDDETESRSIAQRIGTLAFGVFWLAAVYGMVLGLWLRELPPWSEIRTFEFLTTSAIRWPLLVATLGALADAVSDRHFWRAHGGVFISTPGFTALARWLTLLFGGIPIFVPFAAGAGLIALIVKQLERRLAGTPRAIWAVAPFPLLGLVLFAGVGKLLQAGPAGWVVGYISAKLVCELLVLGIPFLAARAEREERSALGGNPKLGRR